MIKFRLSIKGEKPYFFDESFDLAVYLAVHRHELSEIKYEPISVNIIMEEEDEIHK